MRLPNKDLVDYGYGREKDVLCTIAAERNKFGGKFTNATTGIASTTGSLPLVFALGATIMRNVTLPLPMHWQPKLTTHIKVEWKKPGACQTLPCYLLIFTKKTTGRTTWNWLLPVVPDYKNNQFLNRPLSTEEKSLLRRGWVQTVPKHYQWYPL